jgi:hypothetical protein
MTDPTTAELERIARQLCEASRGAGAWDKPRCKRNHWRKRARSYINRAHAVSTADALMAVFGLRRVGA